MAINAQLKNDILHFHLYPVDFLLYGLGFEPEKWQAEEFAKVNDHGTVQHAIKAGRGVGKTCFDAALVLYWLWTREYSRVACTAPTKHQLKNQLWVEIHKWIRNSKLELWRWIEWQKERVHMIGHEEEWFATPIVSTIFREGEQEEAYGLQGMHAEDMLWILDEASGMKDAAYGAIEGSLSMAKRVKLYATGNPNVPTGWFYDAFHSHRDEWDTRTVSYRDARRNWERTKAWAEKNIRIYGEDHPWVRVKVLGEFPTSSEYGLIPLWAWERATAPGKAEEIIASQETQHRVIGVDVADTGENATVFARAEGRAVTELHKMYKLDTTAIASELMTHVIDFRPRTIVIDADGGYGAGLVSVMRERFAKEKRFDVNIVAWKAQKSPRNQERFTNSRTELSWMVKDAIEAERLSMPDDDKAAKQATTIKYEPKEDGRVQVWPKERMKKKLALDSPDEWDAITYALVPALLGYSLVPGAGGDQQPRKPRRQRVTAAGFC